MTVRALVADLALGDHVCLPFESDHDKLGFVAAFAGGIAGVCQYDRRIFPVDVIENLCAAHPNTLDRARLRFARTDAPAGLRVSGEADVTNRDAFRAVLAPFDSLGCDITIDATGVATVCVRAGSHG